MTLKALLFLFSCVIVHARSNGFRRPLRYKSSPEQLVRPKGAVTVVATEAEAGVGQSPRFAPSKDSIVAAALKIRGGSTINENESFLQKYPFASAVAITTFKAVAADLLTQRLIEQQPWDPKRSALFAAFGFIYQGCAQYYIVNIGWERLFPGTKPRNVLAKIAGMNFISDPLLFMPTFYIFREMFMQGGVLSLSTAKVALGKYRENCLLDWRNSWLVWLPGHAVTYGVMPPHKRIPWMAFLSFFYMVVLSVTRGAATAMD